MRLTNVWNLGIKELRGLLRDPMLLALIFYAFSLAIYTGAQGQPETLSRAPVAIVDEDRSPLSTRLGSAFHPPYFLPPALITMAEMDRRMNAGLDTFALVIPANFQRDVLAGRSPAIQFNIDATRMSQAFAGGGYVQAIVSDEVTEFTRRYRMVDTPPVSLALRARFNPELNKSWFGAVMQLINNITLLSIVLTGTALIREREHGTVEHLLVMPVTPLELMASKIWSMALVVLAASIIALKFIIEGLLAVPVEGSIGIFLLGTLLQLFATTSLGIFLATVAGSMPQFGLLLILVLMPLQILSGGSTPRESMPEFIQTIMLAAPNTHFVMLAQAVLYRGAGLGIVWPQVLALLAIGGILFTFSLWRFRKFLK